MPTIRGQIRHAALLLPPLKSNTIFNLDFLMAVVLNGRRIYLLC